MAAGLIGAWLGIGGWYLVAGVGLASGLSAAPVDSPHAGATPHPDGSSWGGPTLTSLQEHLTALSQGALPAEVEPASLFTTPLFDLEAVRARVVALTEERAQLETLLYNLRARRAGIDQELPLPPPPDSASDREAPHDPDATSEQGGAALPAAGPEGRSAAASGEHDRLAAYRALLAEHTQARQALLARLGAEERLVETRLAITRLRQGYLRALAGQLAALNSPARATLASLHLPPEALLARLADLERTLAACDELAGRLRALAARAEVGALLGFQVDALVLGERLADAGAALAALRQTPARAAIELAALRDQLAAEGRAVQDAVLREVQAPVADAADQRFRRALAELRQRRMQARGRSQPPVDLGRVRGLLQAALPAPQHVPSISAALELTAALATQLQEVESSLAPLALEHDAWRLARARELVAITRPLASAETNRQAYSLSGELIGDLAADSALAGGQIARWAVERWAALREPDHVRGTWWPTIARLSVAAGLALFGLLAAGRARWLVLWLVRLTSRRGFARGRIGTLVRWAVLAQTLAPLLLVLASAVLALLLLDPAWPERRLAEVLLRWFGLYLVGRQTLLGLTRQAGRGKPALLAAAPETVELLLRTYGRLGLMLAGVAVADEISRDWLGGGALSWLVRGLAWLWLAGWSVWAMIGWRQGLAAALRTRFEPDGPLSRLGAAMAARRAGALLTPLAALFLLLAWVGRGLGALLRSGGVLTYLRARVLRHRAAKVACAPGGPATALPQDYRDEFPLYPVLDEQAAVVLPRPALVDALVAHVRSWQAQRTDSVLAVLGEKGSGKTTALGLVRPRLTEVPVTAVTFRAKVLTERGLLDQLGAALELEPPASLGALAAHINRGEGMVFLLDEAHNLFLREIGGYQAFEALIRLIGFTADKACWILVVNSYAWQFLERGLQRTSFVRSVLRLPPWSRDELQDLIMRRNRKSGYALEFDEALIEQDAEAHELAAQDIELIEGSDGYFRLLWETSGGNPRVATALWLSALRPVAERTLRLGVFPTDGGLAVERLEGDLFFAVAAIAQHENLSVDELHRTLAIPLDQAAFTLRVLREYGLIEPKHLDPRRSTLAPLAYRRVIRHLRSRHLLYERE